jgi:uncharacterized membrane protein YsdA (DUF1294 family)/cold shock CspA family protein
VLTQTQSSFGFSNADASDKTMSAGHVLASSLIVIKNNQLSTTNHMRLQGKISHWNDAKGIGTITWNASNDRVFVHISAFTNKRRRPADGDIVTYEAEQDQNGKLRAVRVSFPQSRHDKVNRQVKAKRGLVIGSVTALFLVYLSGALLTGRIERSVVGIYSAMSIIAFITYCIDKNAAQQGKWRIKESTLHMMALFGGWPGACAAQVITRHKTVKASFQRVFLGTVIVNSLGFILYSSPEISHTVLAFLMRI